MSNRNAPTKHSIQQEIFNRIEYDPAVERLSHSCFRVYMPMRWIDVLIDQMNTSDNVYFFVIDGKGMDSPKSSPNNYDIRHYIDITLTEGSSEYRAMLLL